MNLTVQAHRTERPASAWPSQALNPRVGGSGKVPESDSLTLSATALALSRSGGRPLDGSALDQVQSIGDLKRALRGADLSKVTVEQSAKLACAMYRTGQFDDAESGAFFVGVDSLEPMARHQQVDLFKHFDFMLSNVRAFSEVQPGLESAVAIRTKASEALATLARWAAEGQA
tara:strand:- start:13204 stop:13722 length:519 start_codon:yes stop_codon:yes gene_type:complete